MALTKQTSKTPTPVVIDFPALPRFPRMTISEDQAAVEQHQLEMDSWYMGLRQRINDSFKTMQAQIDAINKKG